MLRICRENFINRSGVPPFIIGRTQQLFDVLLPIGFFHCTFMSFRVRLLQIMTAEFAVILIENICIRLLTIVNSKYWQQTSIHFSSNTSKTVGANRAYTSRKQQYRLKSYGVQLRWMVNVGVNGVARFPCRLSFIERRQDGCSTISWKFKRGIVWIKY